MGLHAGLHAGGLLKLLRLAAIIADLGAVLDYRLITAPAQRHIDRCPGKLIIAAIAVAVHPHADTQRNRHIIADIDCLHLLQKGKAILLKNLGRLLLYDKQILILFQLLDNPVQVCDVLVDLPIDQGGQERAAHLLHTLQRLVIIIQINQSGHQLLPVDLLLVKELLRLIKQVDPHQQIPALALGHAHPKALFLIHIQPPDIHPVKLILKGRMDARRVLHPIQKFPRNLRKQRR